MSTILLSQRGVVPPSGEWRTGEALYDVKADFCGLRDSQDTVIYTPNLSGAIVGGRYDEWTSCMRNAGMTHIITGDFHGGGYSPDYPWQNPDLTRDPAGIRVFIETMLNTPSADGLGFTPVLMLDGGKYDSTPRWRVDNDWPIILQAMTQGGRDLRDYCIVVPGWELITASQWSSADVSYALKWLNANGFVHIGVHNSPGRVAISSNPVQPDDPWQGDEAGSFKSNGGEHVKVLFFQTIAVAQDSNLYCDLISDDSCPFNRLNDTVLRVGGGYHGWRIMYVCVMETVAWYAYRKQCTPEWGRKVASRCREVALNPSASDYTGGPVTISYGNGLPL